MADFAWQAINASAHLRKCGAAGEALDLLASVPVQRLASPKPHSALLTTRGGALRDLQRRPEALQAGEAAHALLDRDYRPCTLLGALHMQQAMSRWATTGTARPRNAARRPPATTQRFVRCCAACPRTSAGTR